MVLHLKFIFQTKYVDDPRNAISNFNNEDPKLFDLTNPELFTVRPRVTSNALGIEIDKHNGPLYYSRLATHDLCISNYKYSQQYVANGLECTFTINNVSSDCTYEYTDRGSMEIRKNGELIGTVNGDGDYGVTYSID
jgi:hypothetical protein